jgi:hypothetical protein
MDVTGTCAGTVQRLTGSGTGTAVTQSGTGAGTVQRFTGAGTGVVSVTGTIAATFHRFGLAGTGIVSATGSGAGVVQRFTGAGTGGKSITGTMAATVQRIVGAGEGQVSVTGTMAATISRFKGKSGIYYDFTIKSKPLPAGGKLSDFGEIFDMKAYCEFYDSLSYEITLMRDYERGDSEFDYASYKEIINEQASATQEQFRQHIGVTPLEGFIGTMFQYHLVKRIPTDGRFKFFGVDYNIIPRPELDSEFLATEILDIE